jgi:hypothetical protein
MFQALYLKRTLSGGKADITAHQIEQEVKVQNLAEIHPDHFMEV